MDKRPITDAKNPDLLGSLNALRRAAQRARVIAAQTGTAIVVRRNGITVHVRPDLKSLNSPEARIEAEIPQQD